MTAISPYAPPKRNSFLQHPASSSSSWSSSSLVTRKSAIILSLTLVCLRYFIRSNNNNTTVQRLLSTLLATLRNNNNNSDNNNNNVLNLALMAISNMVKRAFSKKLDNNNSNDNNNSLAATSTTATTKECKTLTPQKTTTTTIQQHTSTTTRHVSNNSHNNSFEDGVHENLRLIHQVLQYWFGQYEPNEAQKKLWMIPSSSITLRKKVDDEIADQFCSLLCDIAAPPPEQKSSARWKLWCYSDDSNLLYGPWGKIATIILCDQMSRHIQRTSYATKLPPQHVLDGIALRTAQLFTTSHQQDIHCGMIPLPQYIFALMPYRHSNQIEKLQYVQTCIEHAHERNEEMDQMLRRFRKASNRRLAVLQDEQRRTGKHNNNNNTTPPKEETAAGSKKTTIITRQETQEEEHDNNISGGSSDNNKEDYDDILEVHPFQADLSLAAKHPVHVAMQSFLTSRGIQPGEQRRRMIPAIVSLSGGVDSMVITATLVHLRDYCAYGQLVIVAIHIDYANRPESIKEADYVEDYCRKNNVAFICRKITEVTRGLTNRDLYEKMSRNIRYTTYRQVVEKYSSNQEDNNSQQTEPSANSDTNNNNHDNNNNNNKDNNNNNGNHSNDSDNDASANNKKKRKKDSSSVLQKGIPQVIGVMLGHHKGDLRENVLSNAHKGCGPLDLSGMCEVSQNDGVTIFRPFLKLEKSDIFNYANKFGVPYFKDTTPHWSTRGKIRNKLFPLLEEIYGEGCMRNLSSLATESDECRSLLYKSSLGPFLNQIVYKPMGIIFDTHPWKDQGLYFWKFVLREVLHSVGLGMFSDKSVISFLERVTGQKQIIMNGAGVNGKNPKEPNNKDNTNDKSTTTTAATIRQGWLQCRKDYAVYLRTNGKVFIFYPESFPFHKKDQYSCIGQAVQYGIENAVTVGPWKVTSEIMERDDDDDDDDESQDNLLQKKAVPCMDIFMEGKIQYFIKVPTFYQPKTDGNDTGSAFFVPRPLVFISNFTKKSRPMAWKNADEKIQSTIPLLGNDPSSEQGLKDPFSSGCVHQVDGKSVENPVYLARVSIALNQAEKRKQEITMKQQ